MVADDFADLFLVKQLQNSSVQNLVMTKAQPIVCKQNAMHIGMQLASSKGKTESLPDVNSL
jgi:hypothetical protein